MVFIEPFNFSFFDIGGFGIELDYCDIEWFALEINTQRPFCHFSDYTQELHFGGLLTMGAIPFLLRVSCLH